MYKSFFPININTCHFWLNFLSHCLAGNKPNLRVACSNCKQHFCLDCDIYIHESLHNCPGCESARHSKQETPTEGWWSDFRLHNLLLALSEKWWPLNSYMFLATGISYIDRDWFMDATDAKPICINSLLLIQVHTSMDLTFEE